MDPIDELFMVLSGLLLATAGLGLAGEAPSPSLSAAVRRRYRLKRSAEVVLLGSVGVMLIRRLGVAMAVPYVLAIGCVGGMAAVALRAVIDPLRRPALFVGLAAVGVGIAGAGW